MKPMNSFDDAMARKYRKHFPGLERSENGRPAVFFDGPAGTQVPRCVAEAVSGYLLNCNANHGGAFSTSIETDAMLEQAFQAMADFIGAEHPEEIVFGPNMTTLTFAFSRALAHEWGPGDEIIVSATDHDANITPWVLAARDAGATVHMIPFRPDNFLIDLDALQAQLSERTRLVAVGCASNATGGINPVATVCEMAHAVGAEVFLDAVHLGPHGLIDVVAWDCDWLALSTYKFFGPHLGAMWGRSRRLKEIGAYKVRPASGELPWKWMTGTQSHEAIAGGMACIDYLAGIGRDVSGDPQQPRREALRHALAAIGRYESGLVWQLIGGLKEIEGLRIYGITDPAEAANRCSTVSLTLEGVSTRQMARRLAREGFCVWAGNYYALEFTTRMGLEPEGMIRVGMVHYNLAEEVTRLLETLACIRAETPAGAPA